MDALGVRGRRDREGKGRHSDRKIVFALWIADARAGRSTSGEVARSRAISRSLPATRANTLVKDVMYITFVTRPTRDDDAVACADEPAACLT